MPMRRAVAVLLLLLAAACESPVAPADPGRSAVDLRATAAVAPTQSEADAISANIQRLHLVAEFPHATIVDPRFASPDPTNTTVVGYAHAGDAAIWTGHYLAAEAFRFRVTKSRAALANAQRALDGIQGLVDVTADAMPRNRGLLARFLWPRSWWYSTQMAADEGGHGLYRGRPGGVPHYWIGSTTRDQYSGVFFGLAVAYDAFGEIPNARQRATRQRQVRRLVTRMLTFLLRNGWNVPMPDGEYSTTFLGRPDQQLTLLQIGRHVNPERFEAVYQAHRAAHAANVATPIAVECQDTHRSYYKFNLNHINLYNLIRLETDGVARPLYMNAFATLRNCTATHENAHFNMIERGVTGPDATRDAATKEYLSRWLERPRRDDPVDHRGKYPPCNRTLPPPCADDEAAVVIPVNERVNTDFLWQRSPFLLYPDHPATGTIETAAIDYLLPYWMARYYGVITQ
jgi:hypothetical protein